MAANPPRTTPLLKNIRFLRKKIAEAADTAPETPTREIPEIKGARPREPYYPDGKIPRHRTAPRMMPPGGKIAASQFPDTVINPDGYPVHKPAQWR